jgi:hypothetical protein
VFILAGWCNVLELACFKFLPRRHVTPAKRKLKLATTKSKHKAKHKAKQQKQTNKKNLIRWFWAILLNYVFLFIYDFDSSFLLISDKVLFIRKSKISISKIILLLSGPKIMIHRPWVRL